MDRQADARFAAGSCDYSVAWILLTFLGAFGIHRFYMGKIGTGILWLLTGGLFLVGWLYDFCTLNRQVDEINRRLGEHRNELFRSVHHEIRTGGHEALARS